MHTFLSKNHFTNEQLQKIFYLWHVLQMQMGDGHKFQTS